ncbi:MAG: S8 family serine peptidase, partial [Sarcina sp.]
MDTFEFRKFITGVPLELVELTANYISKLESSDSLIEFIILFGENENLVAKSSLEIGATFENLGIGYGIISIKAKDFDKLGELKGVQYIEFPKVFTINDIQSNIASCVPQVWSNYGLTGKGVLIGIIDTGIDYTHRAFMDEEGNTRIKCIYDLNNKKVYDEKLINEAIKSTNPFEVLNVKDLQGHGTAVASIAAGGGKNTKKDNYGVAPDASIIMVKITGDGVIKSTVSTQMMRGLKFLIDKSNELQMPLVVNISLSANDGAHNGTSLIEKYIDSYCQVNRVAVVVAAGNEGAAGHHYSAVLKDEDEVFLNIAEDEKMIALQIYNSTLTKLLLEITTPSGDSTSLISIGEGTNKFNVGGHKVFLYDSGPKPFDKVGEISINITANNGSVESGQWIIKLKNKMNYEGIVDIWLPITAKLNPQTKFLKPDPFNTLGIPATVASVISVGSYSSSALNYSYFSGRGIERVGSIVKPDILAPGENVMGAISQARFGPETGTSVAAPQVAGVCALMIEWGIVKNNDSYLFGERLKYYILMGATRDKKGTNYPSRTYGYGYLCASKSIEILLNSKKEKEGRNYIIDGARSMKSEILKNKSCKSTQSTTKQYYLEKGYTDFLVQYEGDIIGRVEKYNDFASAIAIDESFAIVSARKDKIEFVSMLPEVIYIDSGGVYTIETVTPVEASKASNFQYNPYLNLTGRGTILGIIDTGIDYLNNEFIKEDGTSNIIRIWDQGAEKKNDNKDIFFGAEYKREDINNALNLKMQGKDPYSIVDTKDENGHGTALAGMIAGRGRNDLSKGIAIDADIAMVKLKPADEDFKKFYASEGYTKYQYRNTDILLGIRYLFGIAKDLNKPIVIYIPLGTTVGGHDGSSVIEKYIDDLSDSSGILFVTSTGNEGIGENHTSGKIEKVKDKKKIELEVGDNQSSIFMTIYAKA